MGEAHSDRNLSFIMVLKEKKTKKTKQKNSSTSSSSESNGSDIEQTAVPLPTNSPRFILIESTEDIKKKKKKKKKSHHFHLSS